MAAGRAGWGVRELAKLHTEHRQLTRVGGVVREAGPAHGAGLVLPPDTHDVGVPAGCLRLVQHLDGTGPRDDHAPVGETDPLVWILSEQSITHHPVIRFV